MALLLASCVTAPKPPTNAPVHDALPTKFGYSIGGPFGHGYSVKLENGYLVKIRSEMKPYRDGWKAEPIKTEYFVPTEERWVRFWKTAQEQRLWSWRSKYEPEDIGVIVNDGSRWHLVVEYRGNLVESTGETAGPKIGNVNQTVLTGDGDSGIDKIEEALSNLMK